MPCQCLVHSFAIVLQFTSDCYSVAESAFDPAVHAVASIVLVFQISCHGTLNAIELVHDALLQRLIRQPSKMKLMICTT